MEHLTFRRIVCAYPSTSKRPLAQLDFEACLPLREMSPHSGEGQTQAFSPASPSLGALPSSLRHSLWLSGVGPRAGATERGSVGGRVEKN